MFLQLVLRNDWTYSEQINNAAWTKTNCTAPAATVTSPSGTATAEKVIEASDTGQTHEISRNLATATNDTQQAISFFVEQAGRAKITVSFTKKSAAVLSATIDLTDGSTASVSAGLTVTVIAVAAAGGWYRVGSTFDVGSGGTTPSIDIKLHNGSSTSYNGGGSSGINLWGVQHEVDRSAVGGYASTEAAAFTTGIGTAPLLESIEVLIDAQEHLSSAAMEWQATSTELTLAHEAPIILDSHGTTKFVGRIVDIRRSRRSGKAIAAITAKDYGHLMATTLINATTGVLYSATSDRLIGQDVMSESGLDSLITTADADVDIVLSSIDISFPADHSVKQAWDFLAARAAAEWRLDPNVAPATGMRLEYNTAANAGAAGWNVSDSYNGSSTFGAIGLTVDSYFERPGNSIRVVGGRDHFGKLITATATDSTSIAAYGTKFLSFQADEISTQAYADDVAAALLARHKDPQLSGVFVTKKDGLEAGQTIDITDAAYGLTTETMLIQSISTRQAKGGSTTSQSLHRVRIGANRVTADRLLRRLSSLSLGSSATPQLVRGILLDSGTHNYTTASHASFVDPTSTGLSINLWVSLGTMNETRNLLVGVSSDLQAATLPDGWRLYLDGSATLLFEVSQDGSDPNWRHATDLNEAGNQWQNVHISWDGNDSSSSTLIWIDGSESSTKVGGSGDYNVPTGEALTVGDSDYEFRISQLAIWSSVTGSGEAETLAADPGGSKAGAILPNALILYHKLDQWANGVHASTGDAVIDSSGQGRDGAMPGLSGDVPPGYEALWNPLV